MSQAIPPIAEWQSSKTHGIIATGHQAALWHPGILAKDIATAAVARGFDAKPLHVVVDQDAHEATTIELPVNEDGRLSVRRVTLGPQRIDIPTGMQPAIDPRKAIEVLRGQENVAADVEPLIEALGALSDCKTLAEQIATLTTRMMEPYTGEMPLVYASSLVDEAIVEALLTDTAACVNQYNKAVAQHPAAGMTLLRVERDRIELPLWQLRWGEPRARVFADVADTKPLLVDEKGDVIEDVTTIAPRALLLTAIMRSTRCDLFVHGKGGWVYDRITEQWWQSWRGETLAPMAMMTANVYLPFDAPVADRTAVERATWYAHHLQHNVDRYVDDAMANEKRDLLAHMNDDRDRIRRAAAFRRLHAINAELAARHPRLIDDAQQRLDTAAVGLSNQTIAGKRDWFFGLYSPKAMADLAAGIQSDSPRSPW